MTGISTSFTPKNEDRRKRTSTQFPPDSFKSSSVFFPSIYAQKLATEVLSPQISIFPHLRHAGETHFNLSGDSTWWMIGPNTKGGLIVAKSQEGLLSSINSTTSASASPSHPQEEGTHSTPPSQPGSTTSHQHPSSSRKEIWGKRTFEARYLSLPGASSPFSSITFGEYSFQSRSSIVYGGPEACCSPRGFGSTTAATEEVITRRWRCGLREGGRGLGLVGVRRSGRQVGDWRIPRGFVRRITFCASWGCTITRHGVRQRVLRMLFSGMVEPFPSLRLVCTFRNDFA